MSCLQIVVWRGSEILCLGSVSNYGHVNKIPTCVSSLTGGLLRKVPGDCCELLSELLLLLSFCHFLASSESFFLQNIQNHDGAINIVTGEPITDLITTSGRVLMALFLDSEIPRSTKLFSDMSSVIDKMIYCNGE